MSLKTAHLQPFSFFYAAGNTPAVSLTQSLPPDQNASLLLLGCGDVRSILFTAYAGIGIGDRKLDYTCCDLEAEIIARNIVAYTLIVDDVDGKNTELIWNIYYHVRVDETSLRLLQNQVAKLLQYSTSIENWTQSPYGALIRFCDSTTFANVIKLWQFYVTSSPQESREQQKVIDSQWNVAHQFQNERVGQGIVLDGIRSYAPMIAADTALDVVGKHYQAFWHRGSLANDNKYTLLNPMFGCLRSGLMLHYGTNPLLGFHLALAHAGLAGESPLKPAASGLPKSYSEAMRAAFTQFKSWSEAFRRTHSQHTLRFVHADAIALCHVLQYHGNHGESEGANWYRSNSEYRSLILDSLDYKPGGAAPTSFDVIETSNLTDHLGSLNMLAATSSLLLQKPTSVIRTEILLPREINVTDSAKILLSGDLPTIALLFGLTPTQYWTNTTATWRFNESFFKNDRELDDIGKALSRQVVIWKPANVAFLRYDANDLAKLLHGTYMEMFQDEDLSRKFQMFNSSQTPKDLLLKKIKQHDLYTRATLCSLLGVIRNTEVTDWPKFMRAFTDKTLEGLDMMNIGGHYFQSFMAISETMGLRYLSGHDEEQWQPSFYRSTPSIGPLGNWNDIPKVLNVTLIVPRKAIARLKGNKHGTPICHLQLSSSATEKQSIFPDVQLGFGDVSVTGKQFSNDCNLQVHDDEKGWEGNSPLIVSAIVPASVIMELGFNGCKLRLALKSTPTTASFIPQLGPELVIYQSVLVGSDVYVTKHRPNLNGHMSVSCHRSPSTLSSSQNVSIVAFPTLDSGFVKLLRLRIRIDICSPTTQSLLQSGATVTFRSQGPFTMVLDIAQGQFKEEIKLPVPLDLSRGKTKIARKSCWVEFDAPLADHKYVSRLPEAVFPIDLDRSGVVLPSLHYIDPSVLPIVNISKAGASLEWLTTTTAANTTMSTTERLEYETCSNMDRLTEDGRIGFKDSIFAMFMHFSGLHDTEQTPYFAISNETAGGINIMILTSSIRMDLANQTVLLDAAVIPLSYSILQEYVKSVGTLQTRGGVLEMKVNNAELELWKHVLPAFAERCRQWKHRSQCEYRASGTIPLSTEQGKQFMCSCGLGKFPGGYLEKVKEWKALRKLAVHVAIPVCYTSPISKDDIATSLPGAAATTKTALKAQSTATSSRIDNLDSKKGACFECGAKEGKAVSTLLKCGGCKHVQYCSPECQKANWAKEHKKVCKQLKQLKGV